MSNPSVPTEHQHFSSPGEQFQAEMDPAARHQQGAHYTRETALQRVVGPTLVAPFQAQLKQAKTRPEFHTVLHALRSHRVLDPSCGSGNFLYAAFRALRDLEDATIQQLCKMGDASQKPQVGLHQLYGLDCDQDALEVARQVLHQAHLSFGGQASQPNLQCGDALFMKWPAVDSIVGNPPFQSKNKRQQEWGAERVQALQQAYPDIPGRADYCVYFFRKAHDHLQVGQRAGLVGTNTIRENDSRVGGLDYIVNEGGTLTDVVSNQRWDGDAVVFVSIVNWVKGTPEGPFALHWQTTDGEWHTRFLDRIPSSLSTQTDVTQAKPIAANRKPKRVFQGQTHGHEGFLISVDDAQKLLRAQPHWAGVLHPFMNGKDLLRGTNILPSRYVIDFGQRTESEAREFEELFLGIQKSVLPTRLAAAEKERARNQAVTDPQARLNQHHQNFLKRWWRLSYPRGAMINALLGRKRYIACSRVTRHPIFRFVDGHIRPSDAIAVFNFDDLYSLGVLQSRFHAAWFAARCSTLGIGLRYTSNTVFDSFPWPQSPSIEQVHAVATATSALIDIRQSLLSQTGKTVTALYGHPTESLTSAHQRLDEAVVEAYGLRRRDDELGSLLSLNKMCFSKERNGESVTGPGPPFSHSRASAIDFSTR